jgi:hypothetical protein
VSTEFPIIPKEADEKAACHAEWSKHLLFLAEKVSVPVFGTVGHEKSRICPPTG